MMDCTVFTQINQHIFACEGVQFIREQNNHSGGKIKIHFFLRTLHTQTEDISPEEERSRSIPSLISFCLICSGILYSSSNRVLLNIESTLHILP